MLCLAFLWHMHQPWYLDPRSRRFLLPWVRLHGTKDYLDMAQLVADYPKIRAVFNFSPCLLEQIELYAQGVKDEHQLLSQAPPEGFEAHQTQALLSAAFLGSPEQFIHPNPRYYELMAKHSRRQPFSPQELRDLQVWSNLSWMDPRWRRELPFIDQLFRKGAQYTEEEKGKLLRIQLELLARIIPTCRELQERGQIELTTSPWSHPILPLLYDSHVALQTNPGMPLPEPFRYAEDVRWHLNKAAEAHRTRFGAPPKGLWPSEGSVSPSILGEIAGAGYQWLATDEEILWKSLRGGSSRPLLYRPYQLRAGEGSVSVVFRDHVLSDLIGFVYSGWEPQQAVNDFLGRLKAIESSIPPGALAPLVLVALDGENAWESYPEDGEPFLRGLYERLSQEPEIRCVTISEYLKEHPADAALESIAPGSWIRGEFSTWIGHESQNRAWEELLKARRLLGPEASSSIAIAEGSDWFWWLGPEHTSAHDAAFDSLFRSHLKNAYAQAGQTPPESLDEPLKVAAAVAAVGSPTGWVSPVIDGEISSYFEWLQAGEADLTLTTSAMARARPSFSRLWWGNDASHLYLRLDPAQPLFPGLQVKIEGPRFQVRLTFHDKMTEGLCVTESGEFPLHVGFGKIVEVGFPLASAQLNLAEPLKLTVSTEQEGKTLERYPEHGSLALPLILPEASGLLWSA